MSLFHSHIVLADDKKEKGYYLNDLPKERLIDTIVKPYIAKEQFIFDGYMVNPAKVKRLKVTETDQPMNYFSDRHYEKMRRLNITDFATNPASLPIDNGKDVTNEIIQEVQLQLQRAKRKDIAQAKTEKTIVDSQKIFVVHGHDMAALHELCRILSEDFHLEPVVLSEQPNIGFDTIISKFERLASDCFAAIILLTPDDKMEGVSNNRARQNVIFELGYFLGMLRKPDTRKIMLLHKGTVEIPSDISGVLYYNFHNSITEVFYAMKKQFDIWK